MTRHDRFQHPPAPIGSFYIHDDAVWLAEKINMARRVAWIRREGEGWAVMLQPGDNAPIRLQCTHLLITGARNSLKRQMKRLCAKTSR